MKKRIHIVSFDVPYPADYGGIIDVHNRIKWLRENGWEVILHCFEYGRGRPAELEKMAEVHYYPRPKKLRYFFSRTPFIVKTRINKGLEKILSSTRDTVLLEGIHCAHYVKMQPGKFWVRAHNIEHEYYSDLAKSATWKNKWFYFFEAKKLAAYEAVLQLAKGILVSPPGEVQYYQKLHKNALKCPPFIVEKGTFVTTQPYVLFHGNLSVEENSDACVWIAENIMPHLPQVDFRFAGKNPSSQLVEMIEKKGGKVFANPSQSEMENLMNNARIHLLWTDQPTGVKLKFLLSLTSSAHVVCNEEVRQGSCIESGFHLIQSPEETIAVLSKLLKQPLSFDEWQNRNLLLEEMHGSKYLTEIFGPNGIIHR